MKVFKKRKNEYSVEKTKKLDNEEVHSETTGHPGQKETWLRDKMEGPEVNRNEENPEKRVATVESDESATSDKARGCPQVNTSPGEIKQDLTIKELNLLKKRIMPLMPGREIE